ncbi:hypothetical protein X801_08322 [Opisthorchis viverrini]|uniref:Uncharacterized protein n=1 Tax=Opisthorchis viverrini TaxID=6198 RepID=A0A1S8WN89_OPIVI|nr:hypothetical protein X801_08322 [Opisthorchis viverrini]
MFSNLAPSYRKSCRTVGNAPGLIQNIQVDTMESASQVTAKWSYEGACDVIDFNVNVYDLNENSLKSMQTTTNSIEISEMPQCVDLIVGVQGRNAHGFGPESKGSRFFILADPTAPIHLPVSLPKIISQESAVVTTLVPKTATSKQRGMNEDRSLAQNQAPEFLSDMPEEISSCDSVATGDCIQSEYQSDQQVVSQVDHTISGRADPEKIPNYDHSLYHYMK